MTKEQKEIIFINVLVAENNLLTAARDYGNNDYRRFIGKQASVYYALYQIIKELGLEIEYSEWRYNGEE